MSSIDDIWDDTISEDLKDNNNRISETKGEKLVGTTVDNNDFYGLRVTSMPTDSNAMEDEDIDKNRQGLNTMEDGDIREAPNMMKGLEAGKSKTLNDN